VGKNCQLLEFSDRGTGDFRVPSVVLHYPESGSRVSPLEYRSHDISNGKPDLPYPLPSTFVESEDEATTLRIEMVDPNTNLHVNLIYTVFHDLDVIVRRSVVCNTSSQPVVVENLMSATLDMHADNWYWTQLSGGWGRERHQISRPLEQGLTVVQATRGASSHQHNPFVILSRDQPVSETSGEVYGLMLVYSGNFIAQAEVNEYDRLRVNMGIQPDNFAWTLQPGEEFSSPEVIMCYSDAGATTLSHRFHRLLRNRLMNPRWRNVRCPILINTWEATYFDVTHDKVVEMAHAAKRADIELLVMDDGWFTHRQTADGGVGDWIPDKAKLPQGLEGLVTEVNRIGLKFGIWIEPEMVSPRSALYLKHPEWCLKLPASRRAPTNIRDQFVLDLGRPEVVDYLQSVFRRLLGGCNIEYVKMDLNRGLCEVFSSNLSAVRQGEVAHRYVLGWYDLLHRITKEFPHVRFEGCAAGGGRFDAGMLYFLPQIWTSDNTDPKARLPIQCGSSLGYPISTMGSHVSATPNHQTHRSSSLKTRSLVALSGTYGFELDPRVWSEKEVEEIKRHVALYKLVNPLVLQGDYYRLWNPDRRLRSAWMMVSQDQRRAFVIAVVMHQETGRATPILRLRGLDPDLDYTVEEVLPGGYGTDLRTGALTERKGILAHGICVAGRTLHATGIPMQLSHDLDSAMFHIRATVL